MFVTLFIALFTLFNLQASSGNQRVLSAEELNKPHPSLIYNVSDLNSEEDPNVASAGGSLQKQEAVSGEFPVSGQQPGISCVPVSNSDISMNTKQEQPIQLLQKQEAVSGEFPVSGQQPGIFCVPVSNSDISMNTKQKEPIQLLQKQEAVSGEFPVSGQQPGISCVPVSNSDISLNTKQEQPIQLDDPGDASHKSLEIFKLVRLFSV